MNGYVWLGFAICAEVIATSALKAVDGLSKPLPLLLTIIGYGLSFWCLSQTLKILPVGAAYAIWSGVGVVLITAIAWVLYRQTLDAAALLGMGLIVAGVVVIHVFSKSAAH